ncbi:hypothetical protein PG996_011080 [Apiospora saccharicola]|uniref:Uncharacterized protein n=1 Tax=Apiospora saccharicola TaxID=335842 RepID=A0ABR1UE11_9PEZI
MHTYVQFNLPEQGCGTDGSPRSSPTNRLGNRVVSSTTTVVFHTFNLSEVLTFLRGELPSAVNLSHSPWSSSSPSPSYLGDLI